MPNEEGRLFTALVLAGSRGPKDPVAAALGLPHKALAPVAGRPMLLRVLDTLRRCPEIGRIAICLDEPAVIHRLTELAPELAAGRIELCPAAKSPSASVLSALEWLPEPLPLLIVTADHPLLSCAMVAHFIASLGDAEVAAAVAAEAVIQPAYPQTRRTYIRLKGGAYSGCNLFAFTALDASKAVRFWRTVERYRKQPWRIFAAAGLWPLLLFLLGRLDLNSAAERLSDLLGVRARIVVMPFAEAAIDVDRPSDLALVERILGTRH